MAVLHATTPDLDRVRPTCARCTSRFRVFCFHGLYTALFDTITTSDIREESSPYCVTALAEYHFAWATDHLVKNSYQAKASQFRRLLDMARTEGLLPSPPLHAPADGDGEGHSLCFAPRETQGLVKFDGRGP